MQKLKQNLTIFLLAAFLFGFSAWAVLKPADETSSAERRALSQLPELSVSAVLDGSWMQKFESYTLDQFPLRESFRALGSRVTLGLFRQKDSHGVYLAEGSVSKLEYPLDNSSLQHAIDRFTFVYETYLKGMDGKPYFAVIPDKNYYLAAQNGYPAIDYDAFFASLQDGLPWAEHIDLTGSLTADDYYRTDLHWRQEKLFPAASVLAERMGATIRNHFTEQTLARDYYGLYSGYAALPVEPDKISYLTNDAMEQAVVTNFETNGKTGVYDMERANGDDLYEMFLSGSVSLLTIENPLCETGRELVIFRDSFASSLAPLLLEGYAKITLVDIRYLMPAMVGNFIDFTNQDVLFLYSVNVLNNSQTIK